MTDLPLLWQTVWSMKMILSWYISRSPLFHDDGFTLERFRGREGRVVGKGQQEMEEENEEETRRNKRNEIQTNTEQMSILYTYTYKTKNGALSWTTQTGQLTKLPPRVCFGRNMHITKFEVVKFTFRYFIWFHVVFCFHFSSFTR